MLQVKSKDLTCYSTILFRKHGAKTEIRNEDVLMSEINKVYEDEKEENRRIRDELLKRLIKTSLGELR